MKWIIKYGYWLMLTVLMGFSLLICLLETEEEGLHFYVKNEAGAERITVYAGEEDCSYVFLPSYADMEQVNIAFPNGREVSLGGIEMKNGAACASFGLNQKYELQIDGKTELLQFCRSANVPTLYVETASGSMEKVYADKEHEELVSVALYSPEGDLEYTDRSCIIKGRGNSTWQVEKKPFRLKLSDEAGLLNMGEDSDWVLLANSHDESNLHNKLILDMANRVCKEWTPRCEYVDVYLNGQYNGLYLLAEKVESGKNRIDINIGAGDFLCSVDFSARADTIENPFYTENDRIIAICEPNVLSVEAKERIVDLVNQQERLLLSQGDLTRSQLVDIDSWVCKYLVDEIAANMDSDLSSSYFYYSDGMFYGGPVWDYDMAFGNTIQNHYPKAFIAKNYVKYSAYNSHYYSALYGNDSFRARMSEIYEKVFLPVLNQMITQDVRNTADRISLAAEMNQIRWPIQINEHPEDGPWNRYINTPESIIHYLQEKNEMLSDVLIDGKPYCTIQFEHTARRYFWTVTVPYGSILANTDIVEEPLYSEVHTVTWVNRENGETFDPDSPVMEDMVLDRQEAE